MALTTLHLAAIPLLAGLAAGTGAVATFVSTSAAPVPTETAPVAVAAQPSSRPCETQTWPYIDRACLGLASGNAEQKPDRPVRVVMAPRPGETPEAKPNVPGAAPVATPPSATPSGAPLVSSDTVLRQPQGFKTENAAPAPKVKKPKHSRREARRQREQWNAQSPQPPTDWRGDGARPFIVVRPLRFGD